jgi:hypothetical protein
MELMNDMTWRIPESLDRLLPDTDFEFSGSGRVEEAAVTT